jgi:hypothetical protein
LVALPLQVALTTLLEIGKTLPEDDYAKQVPPPACFWCL